MVGEGNGIPLQYSCLENPMDRGAWKAAVHGIAEGWTQLSDFAFTFHFDALEKETATHSSVLAWRIPGTGEPGGLLSMRSHRVGHDWSNLAAELHTTEIELNCSHFGSLLDTLCMVYIFLSFYFQLFTSLCLLWWYIVRSSLLHVIILCL